MEVLGIRPFLICTRCKVHMIPPRVSSVRLSCPLPATSSEAGTTEKSCFIFQTDDPKHSLSKKKSHHSALPPTQHIRGHGKLHTLLFLQTEGLLCSITWTNRLCRYPIWGRKLLFILEFTCKWLITAENIHLHFYGRAAAFFCSSENNLMSHLIRASKTLNF